MVKKRKETLLPRDPPREPTRLHLVDRSRLLLGWTKCQRARWLEYHSGELGYGIRLKSESLPLATGSAVHAGLADLITYRMTAPQGERVDAYREAIKGQVERYRARVSARGYSEHEGEGAAEVARIVSEQCALIEGILWGWVRTQIEELFTQYEPVCVEQEEEYVIGCDCGLGDGVGEALQHEARGCNGKRLMTRPDLVLLRKSDQSLHYVEFKTLGADSQKWRKKFEGSVQLALGAVGAERRLGTPIDFAWVYGLIKGWRYSQKDPVTGEKGKGPRMQDSVYCYAYYRMANPPFDEGDWQLHYDYVDEAGERRKATESKGYRKTPVSAIEPDQEQWVMRHLPEAEIRATQLILGPIETPRALVPRMLAGIDASETRILEGLWAVHDARESGDEARVQAALDSHFPQSFQCVNEYGYECQFVKICKGGEEAEATGRFELRRPHHSPELEQIAARGIELPPEQDEESGEEGG